MICDRFGNNCQPIGHINFDLVKQKKNETNLLYNLNGISVATAAHLWRNTIYGCNTILPQWIPLEPVTTPTTTTTTN